VNREGEDVEEEDERKVPDLRRARGALYFGQRDLRAARVVGRQEREALAPV